MCYQPTMPSQGAKECQARQALRTCFLRGPPNKEEPGRLQACSVSKDKYGCARWSPPDLGTVITESFL